MTAGAETFKIKEEARYRIQSNQDSLWLIRMVSRIKRPLELLLTRLGQPSETFKVDLSENDYGGVITAAACVRHNRFYHTSSQLQVPFVNKQLQIHYSSFREKTSPGSTEQWSLKITGNNNEPVAAEVLTSLYDGSLDKIRAQSWTLPDLWTDRPLMPYVSSDRSFSSRNSADHWGIWKKYEIGRAHV